VEQRVKRVVLTSSFAAIGYGHEVAGRPFDERDWTEIAGPDVNPYIQSKTIAERAAWDFMRSHGRDSALCVINPTGIFGPTLSHNLSASVDLVRDVADLHLLAMTAEGAAGQRLLATTEPQESLLSVARMIGQGFPSLKDRLRTQEVANLSRDLVSSVSKRRPASAAKARALGWSPRSPAETILDTAESLIGFGIVVLPQSQATDP
jgi:dihydroflavonol-4-reductase